MCSFVKKVINTNKTAGSGSVCIYINRGGSLCICECFNPGRQSLGAYWNRNTQKVTFGQILRHLPFLFALMLCESCTFLKGIITLSKICCCIPRPNMWKQASEACPFFKKKLLQIWQRNTAFFCQSLKESSSQLLVSHNPLYNEQLFSGAFRRCWLTCKGRKAASHFIKYLCSVGHQSLANPSNEVDEWKIHCGMWIMEASNKQLILLFWFSWNLSQFPTGMYNLVWIQGWLSYHKPRIQNYEFTEISVRLDCFVWGSRDPAPELGYRSTLGYPWSMMFGCVDH